VDASILVFPTMLTGTALALLMSGLAIVFQIRRDRLPDATRLENVRELRAQEERLLAERRSELSIVEQKIQDRDRLIAEVSALEERRNAIQVELASLDTARHEIEEVKAQAAAVAADLATVSQELSKKRTELESLDAQLDPARIAEARHEVEKLAHERASLETMLPGLRAERDSAMRTLETARAFQARHAALELEFSRLQQEVAGLASKKGELLEIEASLRNTRDEASRLADELGRNAMRRNALLSEIEELEKRKASSEDERASLEATLPELRAERDSAMRTLETARAFQARQAALELELSRLEGEIGGLADKKEELLEAEARLRNAREEASRLADELGRNTTRRNALLSEIEDLEKRTASFEDQEDKRQAIMAEVFQQRARRDELADELERLVARRERLIAEAGETGGTDSAELLEDLTRLPACLEAPATLRGSTRTEHQALHVVTNYLKDHRLEYGARTVRAFHTALKINDSTQLTVLAGVSGTGKSLLPRRYAEAMGIHLLQIAVEPRWDSPQDLLGFYNYIERKYRATDLARLLVHMDPYTSNSLRDMAHPRSDHMSLVLLDEMNLARVEYYFSEFLSRLEVRPRYAEAEDERKRKDSMIPIDIRGLKKSLSLFPAHNILFAGTMNDDESTQALSDKVLDRGNVLQFAAPREFHKPVGIQNVERPDEAQSFKSWRTWVHPVDSLALAQREKADDVISKLADIMEDCGRPFGHRLRDAILAYTANYPAPGNGGLDVREPLADQIEFRILPKLRGLEIDSHRDAFDRLETLIRDDLTDHVFAERIADLREKQMRGSGLFVWRGLTRER
jgi:predicted  nucleic acid-binding Zn-ribbon protein